MNLYNLVLEALVQANKQARQQIKLTKYINNI